MAANVKVVDLNADMGESYGRWDLGDDAGVMQHVSSVNIATGYHAGDPSTMRATVQRAVELDVCIGAHVAWPDLMGFGRRKMTVPPEQVQDMVLYQIGALMAFVDSAGGRLGHVKPHGALYVQASQDATIAAAVIAAVAEVDPDLPLYQLDDRFTGLGRERGVRIVPEGYPDLHYDAEGHLLIEPKKLAWDPDVVGSRAVELVTQSHVTAKDGTDLAMRVESLCVHGDAPNGVDVAAGAARHLREAGIELRPIGRKARSGELPPGDAVSNVDREDAREGSSHGNH